MHFRYQQVFILNTGAWPHSEIISEQILAITLVFRLGFMVNVRVRVRLLVKSSQLYSNSIFAESKAVINVLHRKKKLK